MLLIWKFDILDAKFKQWKLFGIVQEKQILNANKLSETLIQMSKSKTLKMQEMECLENTYV